MVVTSYKAILYKPQNTTISCLSENKYINMLLVVRLTPSNGKLCIKIGTMVTITIEYFLRVTMYQMS